MDKVQQLKLPKGFYVAQVLVLLLAVEGHCDFTVHYADNGNYSISVDGHLWLDSSDTVFRADNMEYSLMKKTLIPVEKPSIFAGEDVLGRYKKCKYSYKANTSLVDTTIQVYDDLSAARFSQHFSNGAKDTSVGNMDGVVSKFPSFSVGNDNTNLGVLAFAGVMAGYDGFRIQRWKKGMKKLDDGIDSGPIILFDDKNNVIIISSFSRFMASSLSHDTKNGVVSWGVMGNVNEIPEQYSLETVVVYSDKGINEAMELWGSLMRKWYKRSSAARESDLTVNYLGYYTDNGAYYYHHTEKNKNYEDTLLGEFEYYQKLQIPYRYLQLDDWWYYVEHTKTSYGAVVEWKAMPSVFPHGLQWLYNKSSLPVIAHNRYWSYKTPYAKQNGGMYEFVIDNDTGFALPAEEEFWDFLFRGGLEWGLVNYEQDFLVTQVKKIKELNSDIFLGEKWLKQMGNAANRYNLKLQYCMSLPRHILAALEIPPVSHARASSDYVDSPQWKIGYTSMFLDALGIAPFKDNFWTTEVQPDNVYNRTEVNPAREAIISLLSTGPVGISDKIGFTNPVIAKALARDDGLLLKPSKAATAINQQITQRAFGGGPLSTTGEVYTTYSEISLYRFGIIFASEITEDFQITPSTAGFNYQFGEDEYMAVYPMNMPYRQEKPRLFNEANPLTLPGFNNTLDMHLYYTSPYFTVKNDTIVILGELTKYVPMSPKRVDRIILESDDMTLIMSGQPGELVHFSVMYSTGISVLECTIGEDGHSTLSVVNKHCV